MQFNFGYSDIGDVLMHQSIFQDKEVGNNLNSQFKQDL